MGAQGNSKSGAYYWSRKKLCWPYLDGQVLSHALSQTARKQFSLGSLLAAVTLMAMLSAWPLPDVVRTIKEWPRDDDFDQVRPPFRRVIESYAPITGTSSPVPRFTWD